MQPTPEIPADLEGLDEFVASVLEIFRVPSLAIAVVEDGEPILLRGFGRRDTARNLPATPSTLFPIASCTKAFTTAALGILADEGRLDWDTPVREYVPAFRLADPLAGERITPRDLVCHRSGLPRHDLAWYNSPLDRQGLTARLRHLAPTADLRATWQYQNLLYMVAGHLIEHVAGRTWEEFVRERLFVPLGMAHSTCSTDESRQTSDHALPYKKEDDGSTTEIPFYSQWAIGPAGSINSCVADLARWVAMHLGGGAAGEVRVLSEGQVRRMHAPQMVMPPDEKYPELLHPSYGLGWMVRAYRGHGLAQHGGNIDGFSSLVSLLPRERIGVAVLTNLNGNPAPWVVTAYVCDRLLGLDPVPWRERAKREQEEGEEGEQKGKQRSAEERIEGARPSHPLERYAGTFEHPGYGPVSFELRDGELHAEYNGMPFPAAHYHYDTWELTLERWDARFKATFGTNARGEVDRVAIPLEETAPDIVFARVPPAHLRGRAFLERFAGEYDRSGRTLTVALRGEHALLLSGLAGGLDLELAPTGETRFAARGLSGYAVEFQADEAGAVTAAVIMEPGGMFTAARK